MLSSQEDQIGHRSIVDNRHLPSILFPHTCSDASEAYRTPPITSSYIKPSEMCLGGGNVYFRPAVKQEPVDFSISSLTSPIEKPIPPLPTSVPQDGVSIKNEPSSSPSYQENCSGILHLPPTSCGLAPSDSASHFISNPSLEGLDGETSTESGVPRTSTSETPSKVPVVRICRQNSNSLYTASSNSTTKDTVPLKALPCTSNNVEKVPSSSPPVAGTTDNKDVPCPNSTDANGKPYKRKARLKFSPRIRNSQNPQVPLNPFHNRTNDQSLTLGDKENQNVAMNPEENNVSYRWDMSAFPKCVVQLKKLPLNMETVFLTRESMCRGTSVGNLDATQDMAAISGTLERPDSSRSSESTQSESSVNPLEDGRRKRRSVEPREKARCSFCGMLTLSADVWRHLLAVYKVKDDLKNEVIENQETISCEVCGAGLCSAVALSMHMHNLHNKKEYEAVHKCIICDEAFHSQTYLAFHLQTHYCSQRNKQSRGQPRPALVSSSPDSTSLSQQYECLTCHKKFQRYQALNAHKRLHRQQLPLECNVCGKMFTKSYKLKCHLVVHSEDKPFKCDDCGKMFRFKSSLRSHKLFHMGVNAYKCKYCDQGFMEGGNLLKHIRRTHQGHQSEICNICGKVFTDKQALKYHMRLHTNLHQRRRNVAQNEPDLKPREKSSKSEPTKDKDEGGVFPNMDVTEASNPTSYENSVLFHLLTTTQRDKQQGEGTNADNQQNVDLYEWSDSATDVTSDHDSGMNSPPKMQRECLLCDMMFYTMQKMKKHMLSYHRICPKKLRRLLP